ncbi:MAG: hypothetical protein WAT20_08650, partial [Ferruginibacter sp.]
MCDFNNHTIKQFSRPVFYLLIYLLTFTPAGAQPGKAYSIHFTDTLPAAESFLLYNHIQFKNLTADPLQLKVKFLSPGGWNLLSPPETVMDLLPGENHSLPVSLKKRTAISSIWQQVN